MDILHLSNVKVTHCHSWKSVRCRPLITNDEVLKNLESINIIFCGQEFIQHEQLTDCVGYVHHLHEQVHSYQIVPVPLPTKKRQLSRQDVSQLYTTRMPTLPLVVQTPVNMPHHVFYSPYPDLRTLILGVTGQTYNPVNVDARLTIEESPYNTWDVEHECLDEEHNWYPLVVGELFFCSLVMLNWDDFIHGDVICIGDPADVVRVVDMCPCELGRTPAPDWVAYVLSSTDDHCENYEYSCCIKMVHSVNQIVIIANFYVGNSSYRPNNTVHPVTKMRIR